MADDKTQGLEDEIVDLKHELENFEKDKERIRGILGKIGGVPKFETKLVNILFVIMIVTSMVASVVGGEKLRWLSIEIATVALSVKIIYLMHCQMKTNHFKFWMLSSIEWRINEINKTVRQIKKKIGD